jgi:hypothetical protein
MPGAGRSRLAHRLFFLPLGNPFKQAGDGLDDFF